MRDWSSITFTERDVLQQVRNRIAFAPAKVNVRQFPRLVAKEQQKRRNRIRHCRRFSTQYLKAIDSLTADLQDTRKLRRVTRRDFKEKNRFARRNVIVHSLFVFFGFVLCCVTTIDSVRNDPHCALRRTANKLARCIVELDSVNPQLSRAPNTREERSKHDHDD